MIQELLDTLRPNATDLQVSGDYSYLISYESPDTLTVIASRTGDILYIKDGSVLANNIDTRSAIEALKSVQITLVTGDREYISQKYKPTNVETDPDLVIRITSVDEVHITTKVGSATYTPTTLRASVQYKVSDVLSCIGTIFKLMISTDHISTGDGVFHYLAQYNLVICQTDEFQIIANKTVCKNNIFHGALFNGTPVKRIMVYPDPIQERVLFLDSDFETLCSCPYDDTVLSVLEKMLQFDVNFKIIQEL